VVGSLPSPYQTPTKPSLLSSGAARFMGDGVRATTNKSTVDKASHIDCLLCDASVLLTQMRTHMGHHIICRLYGMNEADLKQEVSGVHYIRCCSHLQPLRLVTMPAGFAAGVNVHLQMWPKEHRIKLPIPLSLLLQGSGCREVVMHQCSNPLPSLRLRVAQTHHMEVQRPWSHLSHALRSHPPWSR